MPCSRFQSTHRLAAGLVGVKAELQAVVVWVVKEEANKRWEVDSEAARVAAWVVVWAAVDLEAAARLVAVVSSLFSRNESSRSTSTPSVCNMANPIRQLPADTGLSVSPRSVKIPYCMDCFPWLAAARSTQWPLRQPPGQFRTA